MNNIRIITEPNIFLLGETKINTDELDRYIEFVEKESNLGDANKLRVIRDNHITGKYSDLDLIPEIGGRICYQSYFKGRDTEEYNEHILDSGHGSVLEHSDLVFVLTGVSRSFTHQLIRHRAGTAFSELSQRFVGANEKTGQWNMVVPTSMVERFNIDGSLKQNFMNDCGSQIEIYKLNQKQIRESLKHLYSGYKLTKVVNEAAREFLPNMVETRIVFKTNLRELRHILSVRGSEHADAQIRNVAVKMLEKIQQKNLLTTKDISYDGKNINMKYLSV